MWLLELPPPTNRKRLSLESLTVLMVPVRVPTTRVLRSVTGEVDQEVFVEMSMTLRPLVPAAKNR